MAKKKIKAIIEASSTGYGVYSDDLPGITGYGGTIDHAKKDIQEAIEAVLSYHKKRGTSPEKYLNNGKLEWEYQYDLPSIFAFSGVLDVTSFAKKINMNPSLLRQYKTGKARASEKQRQKIVNGLHQVAYELLSVR